MSLRQGDAGAGQIHYRLTLVNKSSDSCTLTGFPGVSLIRRDGSVIGAPADREGAAGRATVIGACRLGRSHPAHPQPRDQRLGVLGPARLSPGLPARFPGSPDPAHHPAPHLRRPLQDDSGERLTEGRPAGVALVGTGRVPACPGTLGAASAPQVLRRGVGLNCRPTPVLACDGDGCDRAGLYRPRRGPALDGLERRRSRQPSSGGRSHVGEPAVESPSLTFTADCFSHPTRECGRWRRGELMPLPAQEVCLSPVDGFTPMTGNRSPTALPSRGDGEHW